ncbi:MAG: hypothetical protein AB7I13_08250 [Vicinamibacterales bacterium]
MKAPDRFTFHGTATLLSGRIQRPRRLWLDAGPASVLPANGGISNTEAGRQDFGGVVGFRAGSTHAEGAAHHHRHKGGAPAGHAHKSLRASHAHTGAEVERLFVDGGRVRMTARAICAELTALCPCEEKQPSIGQMDGACFDGIAFGRHRLKVTLNRSLFREHDTHDKICALARGKQPHQAVLHAPRTRGAAEPVITTIVRRLHWEGAPYPGATIDRHAVTIPGFGTVYFGELVAKGATRRLTMLRFELDGAVTAHGACCEVEAGGSWVRPA